MTAGMDLTRVAPPLACADFPMAARFVAPGRPPGGDSGLPVRQPRRPPAVGGDTGIRALRDAPQDCPQAAPCQRLAIPHLLALAAPRATAAS